VNDDALTLTVYFGEHQRSGGHLLSDVLLDVSHRHELEAAILVRGAEGFGLRHTLHTQHMLTLSEDLPLVSVAVDTRAKIERALDDVTAVVGQGLVMLERARLLNEPGTAVELPDTTRLTVYCGRDERVGERPAFRAVVDLLRDHGVAGATAFLGVDGMQHGARQRARFFSRNEHVPLLIVSVGDGAAIAAALPELEALFARPLFTVERVGLCKRDGIRLAEPIPPPDAEEVGGLATWQKLTVYASEQAQHEGRPLASTLVRRLRREGAAGATALRGIWGYSGNHEPHGERLLSLRRTVPMTTVVVDRPARMQRWWEIVDELTDETGLVTSEPVPAFQAPRPSTHRP
jgi:PII-like signaling protein